MTIKTVFLDRDGIINEIVHRGSIISSPRSLAEFRLTEDFPKIYPFLANYELFVVTNQPDVSRGLLDPVALSTLHAQLSEQFDFKEIIFCPHDDSANCECRKPKPGMIADTLRKRGLRADEAVIIGDSYKDILAGQAAGIRTIYCHRSYNSTISCKPDYEVSDLEEISTLPLFQALP